MNHRYRTSGPGTSRLAPWWPVLLSLLVVLVPTVCVLWFMTQAVENRRQVVRRLLADADALVTVLLNLLDNAHKYSGDEKHVVMRAYGENGNLCFEVEDNGIGLSRAAARKVFKRFYQVDRRVSRETGGVGLGLSIVQFIVRAHDGTVRVRSRPGKGSTFIVTIPRVPVSSQDREGATTA